MKFLGKLYFRLVRWITLFMLNCTNSLLRYMIVLKGKDPDVPLESLVPSNVYQGDVQVDDGHVEWVVNDRPRPLRFGIASEASFVRDVENHPILVSRRQYAEKLAKEAEEKRIKAEEAAAAARAQEETAAAEARAKEAVAAEARAKEEALAAAPELKVTRKSKSSKKDK